MVLQDRGLSISIPSPPLGSLSFPVSLSAIPAAQESWKSARTCAVHHTVCTTFLAGLKRPPCRSASTQQNIWSSCCAYWPPSKMPVCLLIIMSDPIVPNPTQQGLQSLQGCAMRWHMKSCWVPGREKETQFYHCVHGCHVSGTRPAQRCFYRGCTFESASACAFDLGNV